MPRWDYTSNTFLKRSASKRRERDRERGKNWQAVMRSDTCEGRGRMKDCVLRVSDSSRVLKKGSDWKSMNQNPPQEKFQIRQWWTSLVSLLRFCLDWKQSMASMALDPIEWWIQRTVARSGLLVNSAPNSSEVVRFTQVSSPGSPASLPLVPQDASCQHDGGTAKRIGDVSSHWADLTNYKCFIN